MKKLAFITLLVCAATRNTRAVDLYGATPTAESVALSGIYFGSTGPTDALASNPAALTDFTRPTLELTALGIFAGGSFHNSTPDPGRLLSEGSASGSAGFSANIPGTWLSLGAAVFPTALLSGKWQYTDPPGTAGVSYGPQTNKSAFLAVQTSFGLAFQASRRLSLGVGLGIVHNINTLETPYVFQSNPTLAGLKALLNLHTSGTGYNANFGAIFTPVRRLSIGLSYKTRTGVRSFGTADGNAGALFNALALPYDSRYHYRAEVDNVFPQSASIALAWQPHRTFSTYLQTDWINWRNAFDTLPVHLTSGDNLLLNTLLHSTSLNDSVPLHWRNQVAIRAGFSVPLRESLRVQGAYAYTNDPVPSGTVTPLTAAIMRNALSTGLTYSRDRYHVALGYQVNLPAGTLVHNSDLLAGEYSDTRIRLWLQTIALTTGIRF